MRARGPQVLVYFSFQGSIQAPIFELHRSANPRGLPRIFIRREVVGEVTVSLRLVSQPWLLCPGRPLSNVWKGGVLSLGKKDKPAQTFSFFPLRGEWIAPEEKDG